MAQPPAWPRHQAVDASARAMVSMTWKNVIGSVSMPFDERGSSRRNNPASCSLSSSAGGSRRVRSISPAAATTDSRTVSARAITAGSPASSADVLTTVSVTIASGLCSSNRRGGRCGGFQSFRQLTIDLLDRFAAGFDAEEIVDRACHQEPAAKIDESQRDFGQRHIRLEVVAGADDQRQADRPDDLADAAEAVGRAHAGGAQMRWPDLGRIGPDNGEAAVGEEVTDRQQDPECRYAHDHGVVIVAGHDGQDAGAEAEQSAGIAPPHQFREEGETDP